MVKFYLKRDIEESTILKTDNSLRLTSDIVNMFLDETNKFYTQLAKDFGVLEEDIVVFVPPNVDNRHYQMVQLCEYYFLRELMFSLSKSKDDIFWEKYLAVKKRFEDLKSSVTREKIVGEQEDIKTQSDFVTIKRYRR